MTKRQCTDASTGILTAAHTCDERTHGPVRCGGEKRGRADIGTYSLVIIGNGGLLDHAYGVEDQLCPYA